MAAPGSTLVGARHRSYDIVFVLKHVFLTNRFFGLLGTMALGYGCAFIWPSLTLAVHVLVVLGSGLVLIDGILLYGTGGQVRATRRVPDRLSNGDSNPVTLRIDNRYEIPLRCTILDELPVELQVRDQSVTVTVPSRQSRLVRYTVRPTRRGVYSFGAINVFGRTPIGLMERRFREGSDTEVPVYPSFKQMQKLGLMAASSRLEEVGHTTVRKVGRTMEFDRIREYVPGDDRRAINWKATARRGDLMVNVYRDERAQPVYSLLNMGRVMEMPFDGMTLLDHSINASLALANVVLQKKDRAGLVGFSHEMGPVVPASRRAGQLQRIQKQLYHLDTAFLEADYRRLATFVRNNIQRRSLLLLFTNFTARSSMERHVRSLQTMARRHPLLVIFFENTELNRRIETPAATAEDVYVRGMAEKFVYEKREIVHELRRRGIFSLLTPPDQLSVDVINEYLELKARGVI